jgi:flagellar biosynthetic protein FliR
MAGNGIAEHVMRMASGMFMTGIKIGAPVIVALLLTNVALGLIARTVPQMNIFIVGLPLRILVGVLALSVTVSLFMNIFRHLWLNFQVDFVELIRLF